MAEPEVVLSRHDTPQAGPGTDRAGRALWRSCQQVHVAADGTMSSSPMTLDEAGEYLARILDGPSGSERVSLTRPEAEVIADLLDELQARLEPQQDLVVIRRHLGLICRELSTKIWDRLGI